MAENVLKVVHMAKPSECNAQQELPLSLLVAQMIDLATDHANQLGIGFLELEPRGLGWVLSRLSVEIARWPKNGEKYELSTWIETYNPHFSERCFSVVTTNGEILGYGRTIWMIIDLKTHKSEGTAGTVMPQEMIAGLGCPIPRAMKQRPFTPSQIKEYVFQYSDLDFYRHVNTVKYISLLLNQFSLRDFDQNRLSRFDIAFAHEAKYGELALISSITEEAKTPTLIDSKYASFRKNFEIKTGDHTILTSSIVLTQK